MTASTCPVVMRGSCLDLLPTLEEASIDLLLCDPPYGTTDLAFDQVKIDWAAWWTQIHRVCKPNANLICFAAQPFATDLINANRRNFRYDLVWQKTNAVGFLSANVRPLRSHELILVFCQKFGKYGAQRAEAITRGMASVYNPQKTAGAPYIHKASGRKPAHYHGGGKDVTYRNEGSRHPGSVQTFGRDVPSLHPTAKPVDLLRWLIRSYSHPGATVLDPFMGGGSTGAACLLEGRRFVGMELDADYFTGAEARLRQACGEGGAA